MNASTSTFFTACPPQVKPFHPECEANWSKYITYQIYYKFVAWFQHVSIIIFNFVLAFIILKSAKLRRNRSNCFFLLLITSHIFTGLYGITETVWVNASESIVLHKLNEGYTVRVCLWMLSALNMTTAFTLTILVAIDRFIAVRFPFTYARITKLQVFGFAIAALIAPNIGFAATKSWENLNEAVKITFYILMIIPVLMLCFHLSIYTQTKKQINAIILTTVSENLQEQYFQRKNLLKRKLRSLIISMFLMTSCILFYLPLASLIGFHFQKKYQIEPIFYVLAPAIVSLNSITDPFIYSYLTKSIRESLPCKRRSRKVA